LAVSSCDIFTALTAVTAVCGALIDRPLCTGVGFAYKQGMLPPALATPIDNILKKTGDSGGATAGGGEGIYGKNIGDGDL
jgi:hypothetical protein